MKFLSYIPDFFTALPYIIAFILGIFAHKYCAPTLSKWAANVKAFIGRFRKK